MVRGEERDYLTRHPGAADVGLLVEIADSSLEADRAMARTLWQPRRLRSTGSSISVILKSRSLPNRPLTATVSDESIQGGRERCLSCSITPWSARSPSPKSFPSDATLMPPDGPGSNSALISSGITLIAVFLGLRQWYEWRARESDLSDRDRRYFFRQDVRRGLGVAVMLILAAGLYFGSRIPPKVGGHANLIFVQVWLAISGLIIVMLGLALLDWIATRLYARRQRRVRSRRNDGRILRETLPKEAVDRPAESEHALGLT